MRPSPVLELRLDLEAEEALRNLGYPSAGRVSPRTFVRFGALWPRALSLISPRGAYRVVTREDALAAGVPDPGEAVAVAVCTIGPALEAEIGRCSAAGEILDALVLDAIGSAAAEATADALNLEVCAAAREQGFDAGLRSSPGYGSWETARQRDLLALLPIASLGISLTSGMMMVPKKSVSFAANFQAAGTAPNHGVSRCVRCHLAGCRHRKAPADCG